MLFRKTTLCKTLALAASLSFALIPSHLIAKHRRRKALSTHIGTILSYSGKAYLDGKKIESSTPLFLGAKVSTENGTLRMAFGNKTLITLAAHSEFQVVQLKSETKIFRSAGMLIHGKIQGMSGTSKSEKSKIKILSPRGEFIVNGGRFSMEIQGEPECKMNFLSLDKPSQLALFAPKDLIEDAYLRSNPSGNIKDISNGLGTGFVSKETANTRHGSKKDLENAKIVETEKVLTRHKTVSLEPNQKAQIDLSLNFENNTENEKSCSHLESTGPGALALILISEKDALKEYNSLIPRSFQMNDSENTENILSETIFPNSLGSSNPLSAAMLKKVDTLNLIPTLDQVVRLNLSNATLILDL